MRVLVCGDRNWGQKGDLSLMYNRLNTLPREGLVIIEGEANGADKMSVQWAYDVWPIHAEKHLARFPADWKRYGKAAGPIRNRQMLEEGKPDLVLAFHHNIKESRGTKDMIEQAKKAGIPYEVIR